MRKRDDGKPLDYDKLERNWYEIERGINALVGSVNEVISVVSSMSLGNSVTASSPGDSSAGGVSPTGARDDHVHGRESFGGVGPSSPGDTTAAGISTSLSRSDHRHGRESFGGVGVSAFADTSNAGISTSLSRSDHRHGREAGIEIESGGTTKGQYDHLNFTGAGVTVTSGGTTATITVSSTAVSPINIESSGTTLGAFDTLNFTGATVTASGTTANVAVSGGSIGAKEAPASTDLILTTVFQDVPGCTITPVTSGTYYVSSVWDCNSTADVASFNGLLIGGLLVGASPQTGNALFGTVSGGRVTASQTWVANVPSTATVCKLQAKSNVSNANGKVFATHTKITMVGPLSSSL